ncbi:adenylyltransferase/cytidyltransferase family protein [Streptomyces sp. NPDC048362]|uniref:adenylyltransferase/cytidyltransferase family protein n=1 Tax=Streptomyces sp. NPDC048362 TaxID=3365539 RepID=UPI00371B53F4
MDYLLRRGYAPGVYDLFHIGHLNLLREARQKCDHLVAGVVTDDIAMNLKGRQPVVPLAERVEIVRSVRYVDDVFVESHEDKLRTWQELRFNVVFKGDDWKGTARWQLLERRFAEVGVEVVYCPYTTHVSSSLLRERLDSPRPPRQADMRKHILQPLGEEGDKKQNHSY